MRLHATGSQASQGSIRCDRVHVARAFTQQEEQTREPDDMMVVIFPNPFYQFEFVVVAALNRILI